jgi:membrane protease YdiL (CAAX protease family)
MSAGWGYFWPAFAAGLLIGTIAGLIAFRRRARAQRNSRLAIAAALTLLLAGLWHGPLGAADRFARQVERSVRQTLDTWEMTQVVGHLHHGPLTRRVLLTGTADDFQRSKLIEYIGAVPGVSSATWSKPGGVPLIVEGLALALLGYLCGLVLAYLVELRRRYNAQWNW